MKTVLCYVASTNPLCTYPIAGDCLPLTIPSNGAIVYSSSANPSGNYPEGTTATHSCTRGQLFDGDTVRTCQNDGTWTGTEPSCSGVFDYY